MFGSSAATRRFLRIRRVLIGLQIALLVFSMAAPVGTMAADPSPNPTDSPSAAPSTDPSATPSSDPSPTATPDTTATTGPTATPDPTATPSPDPTTAPTSQPTPMIVSDKADYAPGSTVKLTGGNWGPDEAVHLFVNDDKGQIWSYNADVTADSSGGFTHLFQLPNYFIANYRATATGATSGSATTSFTDAIQTSTTLTSSPNPSDVGAAVTFTSTTTCSASCTGLTTTNVDFVDGASNDNCTNGTTLGSAFPNASGVATFNYSGFTTSGTHLMRACFRGGGSGTSAGASTGSVSHAVNAGAPAKLGFTVPPSTTLVDSSITPAVQVAVQDASGTTVTTSSASVTLALGANPGSATLIGTKTVDAVNGVATFSDLSLDKGANGYTLTAASTGLTGATSASFNITKRATTTTFSCSPNPVRVGGATSCTATVTDTNAGTQSMPTGTVSWSLPAGLTGATSCSLSGGTGASNSCSATLTVTTSGNKTITSIAYGGDTKHNTSNAANSTIDVVPTGTMTVAPSSVSAGSTNSFVFTFTASQAFANGSRVKLDIPAGWTAPTTLNTTVTNTSCGGTLTRTISGQSVTVAMGSGCAAGNKFAINYLTATAPITAAPYTFTTSTALSTGLFAGIATSPTVTVTAATLDHIVVSPATATKAAGVSQAYTAEGFDQYANSRGDVTAATTFTISPTGGSTGATCTNTVADHSCQATLAGDYTVTGTDGSFADDASLHVVAANAASVTLTLTPDTIAANGSATSAAKATVKDAYNNLVKNATVVFTTNGDVTFGSVTNNNDGTYSSTVTSSTTAGDETIKATANAGPYGTATLHETSSCGYTLSGILAPFNSDGSSVFKYGSTVPVKVKITDCHGNPVANLAPVIGWSMSSTATPTDAINEPVSTSAADTTGVMRFDPTAGQYIYNFATKNLSDANAIYYMYVRESHSNPVQVSQKFGVRSK
jgi:hypothetical protein